MRTLFIRLLFFSTLIFWMGAAHATTLGSGIGNDNGGPKQSWQDIYRNPNLKPEFPNYMVEEREIPYKNLCLVGERIRTKYKYVVHLNFSKIVYDYLYTDRVRLVERCVEYDRETCVAYDIFRIEIPLKQTIEVFQKDPESSVFEPKWNLAFEKDYELKACPDQPKFPKIQ